MRNLHESNPRLTQPARQQTLTPKTVARSAIDPVKLLRLCGLALKLKPAQRLALHPISQLEGLLLGLDRLEHTAGHPNSLHVSHIIELQTLQWIAMPGHQIL